MLNVRRILGLALVVALAAAVPVAAQDDKPKAKLSEAAIVKLAKSGLEEEVVVSVIKKRGISFTADEATRKRLKEAGVPNGILAALPAGDAPAKGEGDKKDGPLATGKHAKGLVVEVLEVKADENKPSIITIRWRYRNPTKKPIELLAATPRFGGTKARPIDRFWNGVYYLEGNKEDPKARRGSVVKDTGGKLWCTDLGRDAVVIKPDEEFEMWAKFPRPEAGTEKISFQVLDTAPLEDIPVKRK
jgi:hypothetical protein